MCCCSCDQSCGALSRIDHPNSNIPLPSMPGAPLKIGCPEQNTLQQVVAACTLQVNHRLIVHPRAGAHETITGAPTLSLSRAGRVGKSPLGSAVRRGHSREAGDLVEGAVCVRPFEDSESMEGEVEDIDSGYHHHLCGQVTTWDGMR